MAESVHPSSAVIPQTKLQGSDVVIDWGIAAALFLITTIGNIGLFGVNVERLITWSYWQVSWRSLLVAILLGGAMQAVLQWRQWANAHDKTSWRYQTALLASVVPSCLTFWPIVVPWLTEFCPERAFGFSIWVLWYGLFGLLSAIILVAVDVLQEVILVKAE